ncbi:MAG: hypothetical protein CMH83_23355 [Nocardioides sp.]|nr:hypothetical protein [Nocardioides sp.]
MLRLVNVARRSARACGGTTYAAAPALNRDPRLEVAARRHARDMATYDYFDHDSRDGSRFSARITAAGYDWSTAGESIAAGYDSPAAVVRGWLDSPGHCANLMSAAFTEMGLGSATVDGSTYGTYWVQDLAAPR